MRLIDADKLVNDIAEHITVKALSRVLAIIQGQPTVKAIPNEFIEEQIEITTDINSDELDVLYAGNLSYLLKLWGIKNGK